MCPKSWRRGAAAVMVLVAIGRLCQADEQGWSAAPQQSKAWPRKEPYALPQSGNPSKPPLPQQPNPPGQQANSPPRQPIALTQGGGLPPQDPGQAQPAASPWGQQNSNGAGGQVYASAAAPTNGYDSRPAGGWEFHAGVIFLRPSADNLDYAVVTTARNFGGAVPRVQPFWDVQNLSPSYQPGFEVGAGYGFADSAKDFQVTWQHLRTSTSGQAAALDGQWVSPPGQTGPPQPGSINVYDVVAGVSKLQRAEGELDFAYDVVNFDLGHAVDLSPTTTIRPFAGLGYARLREQLVSTFYGAAPPLNAPFPDSQPIFVSIDNTSTFSGIGPRLGFDTIYQATQTLSLNGQLAGSVLIGKTQPATYALTETSPELAAFGIPVNHQFINGDKFTHVVGALSGKLGVGYCGPLADRVTFSLDGGYMAAIYLNPFTVYEPTNSVLPLEHGTVVAGGVTRTSSNFAVHGIYVNAGIQW